jgi:HK97 family phage portal protein
MSPSEFKSYMQLAALLDGNVYARVVRLNGDVQAIVPFPRKTVTKEWSGGNLRFKYQPKSGSPEYLNPADVFHFRAPVSLDGLNGLGLLDVAADTIGLAHLAEKAMANLLRKGVMAGGALQMKDELSDEAYARLKESLREDYAGADAAGEFMLMEGGMEFKPFSGSAKDAQFVELRKMQAEEGSRFTGVPRPLLMFDETAWGTGIEQLGLYFVVYCLLPWFVIWEEAIWRLLSRQEKKSRDGTILYAKFNERGLLRGSPIEKRTVLIPQDNRLEAAFQLLQGKASPLVGTSAVVAGALSVAGNARANWLSFRSGRTPAWNDTTGPTTVNRQSALEVLGAYGQNMDGLAEALRAYTDTRATTALDRTTAMDSDGILSKGEKFQYVIEWQVLNAEINALNQQNQANNYPASVASAASNAAAKVNSLGQYLGGLSPAWNNGNFDTTVSATNLQTLWIDARSANAVYSANLAGRAVTSGGGTPTPTPTPTLPIVRFDNQQIPNGWGGPSLTLNNLGNGEVVSLTFSIEVQNQNADDTILTMIIQLGLAGDQYTGQINGNDDTFVIGANGLATKAITVNFTNYSSSPRSLMFRALALVTDAPSLVTTGNNNSFLRRNA